MQILQIGDVFTFFDLILRSAAQVSSMCTEQAPVAVLYVTELGNSVVCIEKVLPAGEIPWLPIQGSSFFAQQIWPLLRFSAANALYASRSEHFTQGLRSDLVGQLASVYKTISL